MTTRRAHRLGRGRGPGRGLPTRGKAQEHPARGPCRPGPCQRNLQAAVLLRPAPASGAAIRRLRRVRPAARASRRGHQAQADRRRGRHPRRRAAEPRALAGVGRQEGEEVLRGRPRRAPHTRAGVRPGRHSHRRAAGRSARFLGRPPAGVPRGCPVLPARRGLGQPPHPGRQPIGHELPRHPVRTSPARCR